VIGEELYDPNYDPDQYRTSNLSRPDRGYINLNWSTTEFRELTPGETGYRESTLLNDLRKCLNDFWAGGWDPNHVPPRWAPSSECPFYVAE
jgi:hypothetical protein